MKDRYSTGVNEQNVSWLTKASSADNVWAMSKARSYREAGAPCLVHDNALHDPNSKGGVPNGDPPIIKPLALNSPPPTTVARQRCRHGGSGGKERGVCTHCRIISSHVAAGLKHVRI